MAVEGGAARSTDFVEALAKGMAILEALGRSAPEMTLSEVARLVGLSPAAARRSLLTLEALGYVGRQAKRFHLTPKIMSLGSSFYLAARIDEVLLPDLRAIVDTYGDASSIGTLDGTCVVYLAHYSVQRARRAMAVAGARYPAFATSMGRVLLAALPEEAREAYLATFEPVSLTSRTLTDRDALRDELARVAADGFATTVDQLDYGITAIAVPIRDADGRTIAALNSSGYTGIVTPDDMICDRLPALRETAMHVSHQIARHPMLRAVLCAQ